MDRRRVCTQPQPIASLAMIGVPPFAWMARVISLLGLVPYFEKARWLDLMRGPRTRRRDATGARS